MTCPKVVCIKTQHTTFTLLRVTIFSFLKFFSNCTQIAKICVHDKAVFWYNLKPPNIWINYNLGKSTKNLTGSFRFFYVTTYLQVLTQNLFNWRPILFHRPRFHMISNLAKLVAFGVFFVGLGILSSFLRAGTLDRIRTTEKLKNWRTELLTLRPN